MKLENKEIIELCQALFQSPDGKQTINLSVNDAIFKIDTTKQKDDIVISIKRNIQNTEDREKLKNEFKEYLNTVSDDIFIDACNLFTKEFGISMNNLNKLLDSEKAESMITSFKEEIKNAALGKAMESVNLINSLNDKYNLGFNIL